MIQSGAALPIPDLGDLDAMVGFLADFLDAYHENIVVSTISSVTITDPSNPDGQMELHLYLFDDVLSIKVDDTSIAFRKEFKIVAEVVSVALESGVLESGNLADLDGDDIRAVFETLSRSDLIATVIPLAIELASQQLVIPVEIDAEELYAIPWKSEIAMLGNIAAFVFDIASASGALSGELDLENLTVEGSDISELFDALADSNLITYATSVAITPLLAMVGGDVALILTIDEDIVWADEFRAIGSILAEVLNTGITYGDIASGDYMQILVALSSIDFTVLLDSSLIKNAIINLLSGVIAVPGLDFLTIPADIDWDIELQNILLALNQLASVASQIDINNIGIDSISLLSDDMIDSLFESDIIVASITTQLLTLDLGGLPIVIPDSVFDERGYLQKTELKAITTALKLVATAILCEPGTDNCAAEGYDISKALTLDGDDLQTLLSSEVLSASVGRLVITMGGEMLVVPASATREVLIRTSLSPVVTDTVSVVTNEEIELAFGAIAVLGITDINNIQLDASILDNLEDVDNPGELDPDKVDDLFASIILHATISDVLLKMVGDTELIVVPYFSETLEVIRYTAESIDFISIDELTNVLNAFYSLNITDFTNFELDFSLIFDNVDKLLESAILHATISNQLLTLNVDMLVVPYFDDQGNSIRVVTGSDLTATTFIAKTELLAAVDALELFGITDIETIADSIDFGVIFEEGNIDIMLESAILHATISKQLFDLNVDMIVVPFYDVDENPIRIVVGDAIETQTEYLAKSELVAAIDALGLFGITDIDSLGTELDFGPIFEEGNMAQMLNSAILHATISKQLIDLEVDLIVVPYFDADGNPIRVVIGDEVAEQTTYIVKSELIEVIDALDLFGITDIDSLGAEFDFGPIFEDGNMALMLDSAILHATISKQLIDLEADLIVVPYFDVDDNPIRIVVGPTVEEETTYIVKSELIEVIDALDLFGITDIDSLGADLDFGPIFEDGNMALMLESAILHATISKQLFDLETDLIVVPYFDVDDNPIRIVVGDTVEEQTTFILKQELIEVINALDLFGISDIDSLGDEFDFGPIFVAGNMALMLESAIIHATVSKQIFDLTTDLIVVPDFDGDGNPIRVTAGLVLLEQTDYITKTELEYVIEALDLFGISDIDAIGDDFDFGPIFEEGNMALMLRSAIIHATVSKQILDLADDGILFAPYFDQDSAPIRVVRGSVVDLTDTEYIVKPELTAIIDALDLLGISDIDSFDGSIDLTIVTEEGNLDILAYFGRHSRNDFRPIVGFVGRWDRRRSVLRRTWRRNHHHCRRSARLDRHDLHYQNRAPGDDRCFGCSWHRRHHQFRRRDRPIALGDRRQYGSFACLRDHSRDVLQTALRFG
ncbi:MAG: hypothetical protein MZU97_24970 [Bacillus subtilis]|nr:hypothetical protein [Bacillus subtilis]